MNHASMKKFNKSGEFLELTEVTSSNLNCSLGFFLRDIMSILDRGFVFRRVEFYFKETNKSLAALSNLILQMRNNRNGPNNINSSNNNGSNNSEALLYNFRAIHMLQLDLLRILSSHEHFTALNLPIFFDQTKVSYFFNLITDRINPVGYSINTVG